MKRANCHSPNRPSTAEAEIHDRIGIVDFCVTVIDKELVYKDPSNSSVNPPPMMTRKFRIKLMGRNTKNTVVIKDSVCGLEVLETEVRVSVRSDYRQSLKEDSLKTKFKSTMRYKPTLRKNCKTPRLVTCSF